MTALSACGFASKGVFAKLLYELGWDYHAVITLRSALALPVLWLWALWRSGPRSMLNSAPRALAGAAAAGLTCYYAGAMLDFRALTLIDAGVERVLLFAYPSIVVLLQAALYRQWPRAADWASLAITYAGILLVVTGLDFRILSANLAGAGLVLLCSASLALYFLAGDRWAKRIGSVMFTLSAVTASTIALGVHYLATRGVPAIVAWNAREASLMAGLVIVATVLPMVLMAEGVRRLGALRASLISTVGPPTTIVLGAVVLHESMVGAQWAGVALIAIGILVLESSWRVRAPTPST